MLAAVTRLTLFLVADADPSRFVTKDSTEYNALARHFVTAYVDSRHGRLFDLSLSRPPGYPAFVAAVYGTTGTSITHVILVQLVLSVVTVAVAYEIALRLAGPVVAATAGLVLAVDPISVAMSDNLTTETLFALVWATAALVWLRGIESRRLLLLAFAGLLVGLSVLVRPIGLYVPLLLVPLTYAFVRAPRVRRALAAAVVLAAFAIPVGLWMARNARVTGVAVVSTIEGHNLLDYRAADAVAIDTGASRVDVARRLDAEAAAHAPRGANAAEVSRAATSLALRTLLHHPKGAAVSTAEGLGRVLLGPGRAELLRLVRGSTTPAGIGDRVLLVVEGSLLAAVLLAAAVGVAAAVRARAWLVLWVAATFGLYDVLLSAGAEGNARLRMPAMPFAALLAGVGAAALLKRAGRRNVR